jgi:hypothetical protein
MAHGKTLEMRNLPGNPIVTYVHRHVGAPRRVLRSKKLARTWKGSFVKNVPYTSRARDLRKGRRLRGAS